jgi:hypothetical protein
MPTLNLAYIAELVFKYARMVAYSLLLASFYLSIAAMWASFVTAFLYFYDVITQLLNTFGGTGIGASADLVQKMYGLLNCIGLIDAFNSTKSVIVSSIMFLLGRILAGVTIKASKYFLDSLNPLIR